LQFQAPKGMSDVLPPESMNWKVAIHKAEALFDLYGYEEIILPVLEQTEVFQKGIGPTSDIVQKEMFTFQDRGDISLTLRPEGTAGVARAFVQSMTKFPMPLKLYYQGPMFRRERPQKGRFRQFFQLGVELIGSAKSVADAEVITLAQDLMAALGEGRIDLLVNSVGDSTCRPPYAELLRAYLDKMEDRLCQDCRRRKQTNPLRVFDCKEPGCAQVVQEAPRITDHLCSECRAHLEETLELLGTAQVTFELDKSLVRGLDYYTRTVFEFRSPALGAQNTIGAGGRYDGLIESYGGPATPATGFSLGLERLLMLRSGKPVKAERDGAYLAAEEAAARSRAFLLARSLRGRDIPCDLDCLDRSLKAQAKVADRLGFKYTVFLGPEELAGDRFTLRDMSAGTQESVSELELIARLEADRRTAGKESE